MTTTRSEQPQDRALSLATEYFTVGKLDRAAQCCKLALAQSPALADGFSLLGGIADAAGQSLIGVVFLQRALRLNPANPDFPYNMGLILFKIGRPREAAEAFGHSLLLAPFNSTVWVDLGLALSSSDPDRAFLCFGRGALVAPDLMFTHREMAKLLQSAGRPEQAFGRFSRALICQPLDPDSHNDLGKIAYEKKLYGVASRHFRTSAIVAPGHATTAKNLGLAAQAKHELLAALRWDARAAQISPDDAELQINLGVSLLVVGRFAEAEPLLQKAAELAPDNARIHYILAQGRTALQNGRQRAVLEALARSKDPSDHEAQSYIHFALAKIHEDLDDREAWFDHLLVANAAKRALTKYDEPTTMAQFRRVKEIFSLEFLTKWSGVGNLTNQPIFIVGMPRSGSTLVEQILASHPKVHAAGELPDFPDLLTDLQERKRGVYPDFVATMTEPDFKSLGELYQARLASIAPLALRVTDKALGNFWYAGLIRLIFPNARIIHTRRDPVDTCLSCFSRSFRDLSFTNDLAELGRYWRAYDDLMRHWHLVFAKGSILDINYEELVADLPGQAARLVGYCGLDWDQACLDFHRTERAVRTASVMQVRQPLYTSSVGRWRPAAEKIAPLLAALAETSP